MMAAEHKRRRTAEEYAMHGGDPAAMGAPPHAQAGMGGGDPYAGYAGYGSDPYASAPGSQMPGGYGQPGPPAPAPYGGMPMGGHPPPHGAPVHGMVGFERVLPCVKLRGLPFDVSEEDVRMFLGLEPVDVLMVKRGGRFSGEAFVVLPDLMQVDMAVAKDKSYLGRRYVEVFRAKKSDYYRAIASMFSEYPADPYGGHYGGHMRPPMGMPPPGPYGGAPYGGGGGYAPRPPPVREFTASSEGIMKLRGLPFSATKQDIIDWFGEAGVTVEADTVSIGMDSDGRPSGIAFVEFGTPEAATAGLVKDRQMMGSRYIECFPSNREELERMARRAAPAPAQ